MKVKREEKNAQSRQRIIDAATAEFSANGYAGAALNAVCTEHDLSKGIIYHHFKDRDELYLACVQACFDAITAYIQEAVSTPNGTLTERLHAYFSTRARFFAEHPVYLGLFADAALNPAPRLIPQLSACRQKFDALNIAFLTELLNAQPLREGLCVSAIVEDFRDYMDFFNMRFRADARNGAPSETLLHQHEERCFRQLDILLHGVLRYEK